MHFRKLKYFFASLGKTSKRQQSYTMTTQRDYELTNINMADKNAHAEYPEHAQSAVSFYLCPLSGAALMRGARVARYDAAEHQATVQALVIGLNLNEDVVAIILSMTGRTPDTFGMVCDFNAFFSKPVSRSGRTIKAPLRQSNRKELAGAGFVGADHYDRAFDNGKITQGYSNYEARARETQADRDFIVSDDDIELSEEDDEEDEEEEWGSLCYSESGAEWDSDEEEEEEWDSDEEEEEEEEWCDEDNEYDRIVIDRMWPGIEAPESVTSWYEDESGRNERIHIDLTTIQVAAQEWGGARTWCVTPDNIVIAYPDGNRQEIGELAMNHHGDYYIHTGEGPADG